MTPVTFVISVNQAMCVSVDLSHSLSLSLSLSECITSRTPETRFSLKFVVHTFTKLRRHIAFFVKNKNCALQGHYAASRVNAIPTFRDNLSVTSSMVKIHLDP
jgi:hypothetical protein